MIISLPGNSNSFPLWLDADVRCRIKKLSENGRCIDPIPSCLVGDDTAGNYRAIAYIRISEEQAFFSVTGMRPQQFNVPASVILEAIAIHDLYEKLMDVFDGGQRAVGIGVLAQKLDDFRGKFNQLCSSTYGVPPTLRSAI